MRAITKGSTDQSVVIRIVDSGDGTPETGVTSATSGLDLKYRREGAATANLTESDLSALTDAHSDGGMLHIGAGYYRVDVPDAAFASGANGVLIFGTVTGMVVIGCYVHLVDYNPQDGVRLGLTALPNAAAEADGGLYTRGTGAGQINQPANGMIDANEVRISGDSTAADNLEALLDGTGGVTLVASAFTLTTPITANATQISGDATAADNAEAFFDGTGYAGTNNVIPTVTTLTNLPAITNNWLTTAGIADGALTAAKLATDCIGAAQLAADCIGSSELAATAIAEIQAGLSTLDAAGVRSAVGLASANLDTQLGTLATAANLATVAGYLDTEIAAILADTNELQTDWANGGRLDLLIDAIKAKTDNLPAAPAATGDIPTAAQNAAALLDLSNGVETSITPRQALRLLLAAAAGKLSGAATTTIVIRNVGDSKDRITATVDADGNRSAVTVDGT